MDCGAVIYQSADGAGNSEDQHRFEEGWTSAGQNGRPEVHPLAVHAEAAEMLDPERNDGMWQYRFVDRWHIAMSSCFWLSASIN